MKWEDEEFVVDLYGTRGKKYSAFALALGAYLLLISLLMINLSVYHPFHKEEPLPLHPRRPAGRPAPVKFAQLPPLQPAQQPLLAPPSGGHAGARLPRATPPTHAPRPPQKAVAPQQKPQKMPALSLPHQPPPLEPTKTVAPQVESLKQEALPASSAGEQEPQPEIAPAPLPTVSTRHTFQSRSAWFKKTSESTPAQRNAPPQPAVPASSTAASEPPPPTPLKEQLNTSFRQFLKREAETMLYESGESGRERATEGRHGTGNGNGYGAGQEDGHGSGSGDASRQARRFGQELFLSQLVYTICDASHQNPLRLHGDRIPLHITILRITINRKRQVERVVIDQASPDDRINTYLKTLVHNTNLPQLPADWEGDTLTVPLRVRIETHPQMDEIRLVPASW